MTPRVLPKLKGLEVKPGQGSAFAVETPSAMPKAHMNALIVGCRGSGKTTACVNLLEKLKVFDFVICLSPTMASNADLMARLPVEHVYQDLDDPCIVDKVKAIVEAEAADLDRFREQMKRWRALFETRRNPVFDDDALLEFFDGNGFQKPKHRWGGRPPVIAVIVDDGLGSALFSKPRKITNLAILHRHVGQLSEGGAIGVSLFFLVQSYKTQVGGLPKTIRGNATLLILFRTKSCRELDDIAEELACEIEKDKFLAVFEHAIKEPHDFLMVDLFCKPWHPSVFRRNFDQFILP